MENGEPTHSHSHSHNYFKELFDTNRYTHSNNLILASILLLFCVIILILFIHTYARCYLRRARRLHHQRQFSDGDSLVFYVDPNDPSTLLTTLPSATATATGLSASLIAMLPVFGYFPNTEPPENPLECAVCLSEFREGEIGRVLPKCHHAFHTDCIDMWFRSHITCPLCRATVEAPPEPDIGFGSVENRTGSGETKPSFLEDIIIEYPFRTREGSVGDSPSTQSSSSSFSVTRILPPFDGILGKDWRGSGSSSLGDGGGGGGCSGSDDELNGGMDETQRVGSEVTRDECDDVEIVEEPKS